MKTRKTRIPELKPYQGRNPEGYFADLTREQKQAAERWLWRFRQRWGRDLPRWRFAILVGQARRLAKNPPTSAWGRTMRAIRGGLAVQRLYRREGRDNPIELAHLVRKNNARMRREAKERERLGLPPRARHGFTV